MCLDRVKKHAPKPTGKGWKVFVVNNGALEPMYCYHCGKPYPLGQWIHRDAYDPFPLIDHSQDRYLPGFYIFKWKHTAKYYATHTDFDRGSLEFRRVHYRGAYVKGHQMRGYTPTVIAEEIYICGSKPVGTENE